MRILFPLILIALVVNYFLGYLLFVEALGTS